MIILIILTLIAFWVAMMSWIYSTITPFMENIWDIKNYNIAYYWALSSIERAELVLKYHKPWFEWSWWRNWSTTYWPNIDKINNDFWLLTFQSNWMWWTITSRSTWYIPLSWNWNIDKLLSYTWSNFWWPSSSYNKLDYNNPLDIYFDFDNTSNVNNYYNSWINRSFFNWSTFTFDLRLPPLIKTMFANAWINEIFDIDWDLIPNDWIVLRSFYWNNWAEKYSIFPTIDVNYVWGNVNTTDTLYRESQVNLDITNDLTFSNVINPVYWWTNSASWHNVIPESSSLWDKNFDYLINNTTWENIKLTLSNLLTTTAWDIYPYLEYKLTFNPIGTIVPWNSYKIKWYWKVWKYYVNIDIDKPISSKKSSSSFTVLF